MTEKFGLNEKNLKLIIEALSTYPEISEAIIFGSRALGNYKPGSDIDIALKGNIDQRLLARIKAHLEDEISTPYMFDVVVYQDLENKNMIDHINSFGVLLYKC